MNQESLDFFKQLLLKRREQASEDLQEFERVSRSNDAQESSEDRSAYSLHMADRGTDAMEREKNLLFLQREGSYIAGFGFRSGPQEEDHMLKLLCDLSCCLNGCGCMLCDSLIALTTACCGSVEHDA